MSTENGPQVTGAISATDFDAPGIDLFRPAGPQIYHALKSGILRMALPPGCLLSETEIGTKFGASRTPVREALLRLREAGLVVTYPSRGSFVARLNKEAILEAQFLRESLELGNVRRLVEFGLAEAEAAELQGNLAAQEDAVARGDGTAFQDLDDQFHLQLALATGISRAARVLEREKMVLDRLRVLSLRDGTHLRLMLAQHKAMFEAINAGDSTKAETVAMEHLRSVIETMDKLARDHGEYFE